LKITKHFWLSEFRSKDGVAYPATWIQWRLRPLCEVLELIRALTGQPVTITSGYRTEAHNKKIGGAKNSRHTQGRAADFRLKGMTPKRIFEIVDRWQRLGIIPKGGLKAYATFVHIDLDDKIRRW